MFAFLDELSFIVELPFIIELSFIAQLSSTIELSSLKNDYANFPAFGRDFKKTSLLFLTSCPLLLSCPLSLSYLLLLSCPLLLSFLPWRMNMLTSRPSAGIEKKHHCFSWWAVLCYWAALYCWAAFHCSAVLYFAKKRKAAFLQTKRKQIPSSLEEKTKSFSCFFQALSLWRHKKAIQPSPDI